MNKNETDRLLDALLAGDELDVFRRASLEESLALVRGRNVRRQRIRRAALVAVLFLALAILLKDLVPGKPTGSTRLVKRPVSKEEVEIISDEQLFALFPNRPLALVGKPGQQQLVFLDELNPPKSAIMR
ncbi:MAG TPA: hypothetical protein VLT36_22535 [Candidatus Dormibacteraeota bacterium]|nr:hypothetical protein [Candidatus Dormibacteraeota bacterium]